MFVNKVAKKLENKSIQFCKCKKVGEKVCKIVKNINLNSQVCKNKRNIPQHLNLEVGQIRYREFGVKGLHRRENVRKGLR